MYKFILVHIVICIIYFVVSSKRCNDEAIYKFIVALFIPVLGLMYFFILYFLVKIKCDSSVMLINYEKSIRNDVSNIVFKKLDINKEINIVPVQEALILNNSKITRSLLIDIVKEKPENHISILKKALENNDMETSHYAAVAIVEIKNQFVVTIQEISVKYETNKKDSDVLISYVDILKKYLDSDLLDEKSHVKYKYLYSERLGELLEVYETEPKYFIDKINCEIELNNLSEAKEYCNKFQDSHKNNEETYLMFMKFYHKIEDYDSFKTTLDSLKHSSIKLSNKALNIVRFWSEGDKSV